MSARLVASCDMCDVEITTELENKVHVQIKAASISKVLTADFCKPEHLIEWLTSELVPMVKDGPCEIKIVSLADFALRAMPKSVVL